jgi:hypothetical protein
MNILQHSIEIAGLIGIIAPIFYLLGFVDYEDVTLDEKMFRPILIALMFVCGIFCAGIAITLRFL